MVDHAHPAETSPPSHAPLLVPALVGLYAWLLAISAGATLLDIVYAGQLRSDPSPGPAAALAEVSDLLLGMAAATVLAGIAAVAAAWRWKAARFTLVISVSIIALELLTPALLSGAIQDAQGALGVSIGPWLRFGISLLASMVAFVGLWQVSRGDPAPTPAAGG